MFSLHNYLNNSLIINIVILSILYFIINLFSIKMKPTKLFIQSTTSNNTQLHNSFSQNKSFLKTYINLFWFLFILLILDTNNSYWLSNFDNYFFITNHIFFFTNVFFFVSVIGLNILIKILFKNYQLSIELIFTLFIFILSSFFYFFISNILYLFFLFELQGLLFLYLINTYFFSNKFHNKKLIFNLYLLQFWLTFFSSLLFLILIFWTQKIYTSLDLYEINMIGIFLNKVNMHIFCFCYLIIFLFKLGIFPFYLWKLDLFKLLPSAIIYCYNVFYTTTLLLIIINYSYLLPNLFLHFNWLLEIYILVVLLVVPTLFYLLTELRSFFLISSNLQLNLILLILFNTNNTIKCLSLFNSIAYIYLLLLSSVILLLLAQLKVWFITDLQFIKHTLIWNLVICFLLSAAGIPPFWGFFCKLSLISFYFSKSNLLIACLLLISGYCSGYFYWQFIRFYSLKNSYLYMSISYLKINKHVINLSFILIIINICSIWFLFDIFIFSSYLL